MRIFSVAVAIIVLIVFYLFTFERDLLNEFAISNSSDTSEKLILQSGEQAIDKKTDIDQTSFSVVVKKSDAQSLDNLIILRGRSEAVRQVSVKSQTTGLIISEPLPKGSKITKNQVGTSKRNLRFDINDGRFSYPVGYENIIEKIK